MKSGPVRPLRLTGPVAIRFAKGFFIFPIPVLCFAVAPAPALDLCQQCGIR